MSLKIPRWFKILVVSAIGIFAVILIALFVYVKTLDLNKYAGLIDAKIESATGRDFRGGNLRLSVFPGIELIAEDLHFSNADWGSSPEMVKIKRLDGRVAIIPLLQRRLEIDRFEVKGATILIEENKKGVGNWVFTSPNAQKTPESPEKGSSFQFGGLDEVLFEDTAVIIRREGMTEPMRLDIRRLEIQEGGLPRKNNFKLDAVFRDQPFTSNGTTGLFADIMKKGKDWPLNIDFNTDGTSLKIQSILDWSSSPPPAQGDIDLKIEDSTAFEKLLDTSLGLPLPLTLAATVKSSEDHYAIEPLKSKIGDSEVSGSVSIKTGGKRPAIVANLKAPSLDLSGRKPSSQSAEKSGGRVFSDEPFPLELLKTIDADVDVKIDRLILTNKLPVEALQVFVSVQNGILKINPLTAAVGGGNIKADLTLAATGKKTPHLKIKANGKNISGEKLAAAMGYAGSISGGSTDVTINLSGPGTSMARFMGGANGEARLVMGPAVFQGKALDWGGDALTKLSDLVNPFRREEKKTNLLCWVVRLPAKGGIITVDHSIAMETNRLNVVAAGMIDLRNETVNLGFRTRAKEGIGIGAVNLAELVKVSGPLSNPSVGADTIESAKKALTVGGALATGGLSLIGQTFLKRSTADPHPCQTALTGRSSKSAASAGEKKKPKQEGGVLEGLKNLFKSGSQRKSTEPDNVGNY